MNANTERGSHPEDEGRVRAMARGDRAGLAALYDAHVASLCAVARRILCDAHEVEDLLHDVFLEAWRHAHEYDPTRGSVRSWLLIRVRSRALDRRRSHRVMRSVPLDLSIGGPLVNQDEPRDTTDHARLRRALNALSVEQRTVLELGYFEGLSSTEIAERIGTPIGTVKSRAASGLTVLRRALLEPTDAARATTMQQRY